MTMEAVNRDNIVQGITDNIFVEAGAGAGKTTLIIKRIVNQLRQGVKPEHLVVITFTNAAAGELYGRMSQALVKELREEGNSKEEEERLKYALEHMDRMTISTIHSFCFKLLKERCFEAELPMEAELLEPADTERYQVKFLKAWLAGREKEEIRELQNACILCKKNKYFREWLEQVFVKICDKPEDVLVVCPEEGRLQKLLEELQTADLALEQQISVAEAARVRSILAKAEEKKKLEEELGKELDRIAAQFLALVNQQTKSTYKTVQELIDDKKIYKDIEALIKGEDRSKRGALAKKVWEKKSSVYQKGRKAEQKAVAEVLDAGYYRMLEESTLFRQLLEQIKAAEQQVDELPEETALKQQEEDRKEKAKQYFYYILLKYAKMAAAAYKEARTGRFLTNDELLERAKNLVCSSEAARTYFAGRYRCIYVDEFQDTDHIQAELIWKLCCEENGQLRAGSLFVVGDPKQAIYRFRGGEPAVYYDIKDRMKRQGEGTKVYELSYNYRSNESLIDWVNVNFSKADLGGTQTYRGMECRRASQPEMVGVLQGVYTCNSRISDVEDKKKAETEAKRLAELVLELTGGNCRIYDGKEEKLRNIEYKDFLILCWKMEDMKLYMQEFRERGIPVEFSGRMRLKDSRLLHNFCRIYHYLASYGDRKAKEGIRPVVKRNADVTATELLAKERMELLVERTKGLDAYALAEYLVSHPEYVTKWDTGLSREDLYLAQVRLRQMVETVCRTERGTAKELAAKFVEYREKELERELPLKEKQNAVRFMNLHKAKGLEGSIVILTNRKGYGDNRPRPELTTAEKNGNGCYEYYGTVRKRNDYTNKTEELHGYLEYPEVFKRALKEEKAEDTRLEYVAATRAKEALIVMSAYRETAPMIAYEESIRNSIEEFLNRAGACGSSTTPALQFVDYVQKVETFPAELAKECYTTLSPSELESHVMKKAEESEEQEEEKRPKGKVFGTVMHRSFELLVSLSWENLSGMTEEELEQRINASICQAIMEQAEDLVWEGKHLYFKEEETKEDYLLIVQDYLKNALRRFVFGGTMKEFLQDAEEVYTELPFSYYIYPEKEEQMLLALKRHLEAHKIEVVPGRPIWVNGTADLVIRKKDGTVLIVDYKSDSLKNYQVKSFEWILEMRYEGQLLLYRYSMSKLFGVGPGKIEVRLQHLY